MGFRSFLNMFLSGRPSVGAKKAPGSERVLGGLRTRATFPGAMFRSGNSSIRVHYPHEPTLFPARQQHIRVQLPSVISVILKEETSLKHRKTNSVDPRILVLKDQTFLLNDLGRWWVEAHHCDGGKIDTTTPSGQLRF